MDLFRPRKAIGFQATLLSLSLLLLGACETQQSSLLAQSVAAVQAAIINGEQCLPNEHESALELFLEAEIDFGTFGVFQISTYMCGGTLIAPDVVLTAAHCLDPKELTYGIGTIKHLAYYVTWDQDLSYIDKGEGASIPKNAVAASSWMIQEGYDGNMDATGPGNFHDVGLVFLAKPLTIKPAIVITKQEASQITAGKSVSIAGWGQRTADTIDPSNPAEAALTAQKYCAQSTINEAGTHEIQVGSGEKSSRKCFGDSGGPTYMDVSTPDGLQTRVIGITSHAYDESVCLKGGLDTRVDAWLGWIDAKMREGCQSGARSWCEVEGIIPPELSYSARASLLVERLLAYILSWIS